MKRLISIIIMTSYIYTMYSQTDKDPIIIGGVSGGAPYCYSEDESNPDGFSVDVVRNLMTRLDIPYKRSEERRVGKEC